MNKVKFYQFIIVGLLVSNIILLAFMFLGKKTKPNFQGPKKIIEERLGFTSEQMQAYEKLIIEHKSQVDKEVMRIKDLKNALYSQLTASNQDSLIADSIRLELAQHKDNIEKVHFEHFLDIKGLCNDEQLPKFEALTKDLARLFAPHKPLRRPPPPGKR